MSTASGSSGTARVAADVASMVNAVNATSSKYWSSFNAFQPAPPLLQSVPLPVVSNLLDAFSWMQHGFEQITTPKAVEGMTPQELISRISGREITTSGAFFGIGASEVGDAVIEAGCKRYIDQHAA
eukprot:3836438-Alexandrium_andersonii.AAC.1